MSGGLPVVSAPAEIDVTTAEKLRTVLLEAATHGHATVVVDLTGTRLCDSSGLKVLAEAHRRALADSGELRLAVPADGPVARVLAVTTLDRFIPCFPSLGQALAAPLPAAIPPGNSHQRGRLDEEAEQVAQGTLEASVTTGESGPLIILAGEADLTSAEQLSALITGQLADGTRQLTIDVSGLRFADSASIRTLVLAGKTLRERGGSLVLLYPQQPVARVLALVGAEQMLTIRGNPRAMEDPKTSDADGQ